MKLKIFCRCSSFLSGLAKDLSAPLYDVINVQHVPMTLIYWANTVLNIRDSVLNANKKTM